MTISYDGIKSCYRDGYQAYKNGKYHTENPFSDENIEQNSFLKQSLDWWNLGWNDACVEHLCKDMNRDIPAYVKERLSLYLE